jgi:hypothetical protein
MQARAHGRADPWSCRPTPERLLSPRCRQFTVSFAALSLRRSRELSSDHQSAGSVAALSALPLRAGAPLCELGLSSAQLSIDVERLDVYVDLVSARPSIGVERLALVARNAVRRFLDVELLDAYVGLVSAQLSIDLERLAVAAMDVARLSVNMERLAVYVSLGAAQLSIDVERWAALYAAVLFIDAERLYSSSTRGASTATSPWIRPSSLSMWSASTSTST